MRIVVRGLMHGMLALALGAMASAPARADFAGGGPAATDCFLQFTGIAGPSTTCTDGDPSCDTDGAANGSCTFGVSACTLRPSASCTAAPLDGPPTVTPASDAASTLAAAIAQLDPVAGGCTTGGIVVPLKISLAGIKAGKLKLTVVAAAGGKKDKDKLKLTCAPSAAVPSFANDVLPIFGHNLGPGMSTPGTRCAVSACHTGPAPSQGLNLDGAGAYASIVNARSTTIPKLFIVKPKSLKASTMARATIGGSAVPPGGLLQMMPQGCPNLPPANTGCLTDPEKYTLLAWIKGGAPNN